MAATPAAGGLVGLPLLLPSGRLEGLNSSRLANDFILVDTCVSPDVSFGVRPLPTLFDSELTTVLLQTLAVGDSWGNSA